MTSIQEAAGWLLPLLALALAGALVALVRSRMAVREQRRRNRELLERTTRFEKERAMLETDAHYLAEQQLPTLMRSLWQGQPVRLPAPHPQLEDTPFGAIRVELLRLFEEMAGQAGDRAEAAAKAAVSTMARSMQMLVSDTTNAVDAMLEKHHDPEVLEDATAIDHASNQLVRRLQGMNVLTGSWPGRQREPAPLLDVVRGGVSKIRDYTRVQITGRPSYALVGRAVEPVVLAVAELLDNAARHSEPGSSVRVGFTAGHNGVTITIDDAGMGLKPEEAESAPGKLAGGEPVRLTQLGSRPEFGFRVVGALAHRYGFRVSVNEESIYGGVRAALFLPSALLSTPGAQGPATTAPRRKAVTPPAAGSPAEPAGSAPAKPPEEAGADSPAEQAPAARPDGLPQRKRRTTRQSRATSHPEPPTGSGRALGAFQRGINAAKADHSSDERNSQ